MEGGEGEDQKKILSFGEQPSPKVDRRLREDKNSYFLHFSLGWLILESVWQSIIHISEISVIV